MRARRGGCSVNSCRSSLADGRQALLGEDGNAAPLGPEELGNALHGGMLAAVWGWQHEQDVAGGELIGNRLVLGLAWQEMGGHQRDVVQPDVRAMAGTGAAMPGGRSTKAHRSRTPSPSVM